MIQALCDTSPEVRQAAAYGIGVMAQFGGESYRPFCTGELKLLTTVRILLGVTTSRYVVALVLHHMLFFIYVAVINAIHFLDFFFLPNLCRSYSSPDKSDPSCRFQSKGEC